MIPLKQDIAAKEIIKNMSTSAFERKKTAELEMEYLSLFEIQDDHFIYAKPSKEKLSKEEIEKAFWLDADSLMPEDRWAGLCRVNDSRFAVIEKLIGFQENIPFDEYSFEIFTVKFDGRTFAGNHGILHYLEFQNDKCKDRVFASLKQSIPLYWDSRILEDVSWNHLHRFPPAVRILRLWEYQAKVNRDAIPKNLYDMGYKLVKR